MTGRGGLVMRWTDKTADDRQLISSADLQSAIREAVKQFDPECKDFIDVIVEQRRPQSRLEANWCNQGRQVWSIRSAQGGSGPLRHRRADAGRIRAFSGVRQKLISSNRSAQSAAFDDPSLHAAVQHIVLRTGQQNDGVHRGADLLPPAAGCSRRKSKGFGPETHRVDS
jgi:hypothetical protein